MAETKEKKAKSVKPSWIKMKPAEMEKLVIALAKEGKTPAQIGLVLRDKHGVPKAKLFGKGIIDVLEEKGIEYKSNRRVVDERIAKLKGHIAKNKHDYPAARALTKELWALHRLEQRD